MAGLRSGFFEGLSVLAWLAMLVDSVTTGSFQETRRDFCTARLLARALCRFCLRSRGAAAPLAEAGTEASDGLKLLCLDGDLVGDRVLEADLSRLDSGDKLTRTTAEALVGLGGAKEAVEPLTSPPSS